LLWELAHRGVYAYAQSIYHVDDADEWRYTACSRLVEHGHALFTEVFSAQPPLLFASLSAGMRVFGDSIAGARWIEIGFGLVSLICAAWIASLLAGPIAGATAALLLSVSPGFLVYSHAVEAEVPMMALVTLSLALALTYARTGSPALPVLAGLSIAAAMLMKLFAAEALLPGLWLITACRSEIRGRRIRAASSYLFGAAGPLAADFAFLHPSEQWDQVITLHERAARVRLPDLTPPAKILGQFLSLDLGLTLLAVAGLLAVLSLRRWNDAGFLASWLVGSLLMLYLFRPLFPHHPVILLTGLAAAAGTGVGLLADRMDWRRLQMRWYQATGGGRSGGHHTQACSGVPGAAPTAAYLSVSGAAGGPTHGAAPTGEISIMSAVGGLLVAIAVFGYLVLVPRLAHDDRHVLIAYDRPQVRTLSEYVRRHSAPTDFVALDDLAVADMAHRLVPPPLCDPSNVRLKAGYLTAHDLIESVLRYHAKLVLPSAGVYQQVGPFIAWLNRHGRRQAAPDGRTAYFPTGR
jgi:hypothetical protein